MNWHKDIETKLNIMIANDKKGKDIENKTMERMKGSRNNIARGGASFFGRRLLSATFTNLSVRPNLSTKQK